MPLNLTLINSDNDTICTSGDNYIVSNTVAAKKTFLLSAVSAFTEPPGSLILIFKIICGYLYCSWSARDEFHFRWLKNSVFKIGNAASNHEN